MGFGSKILHFWFLWNLILSLLYTLILVHIWSLCSSGYWRALRGEHFDIDFFGYFRRFSVQGIVVGEVSAFCLYRREVECSTSFLTYLLYLFPSILFLFEISHYLILYKILCLISLFQNLLENLFYYVFKHYWVGWTKLKRKLL